MANYVNPEVAAFPRLAISRAARCFPTPFFLYDEKKIRANCRRFKRAFQKYFPSFEPLYAVKANTNPDLLKIIFSEGFGADASSEAEVWVARRLGAGGMYTGNYTTAEEFQFVRRAGGFMLNLDDASMLPTIQRLGVPKFLSFRVNPGISQGGMKSLFLAGPDAKYGVPIKEAVAAYARAQAMGVRRFGIHAMTGSNVLDAAYFPAVAERLLALATQLHRELGMAVERVNIGGGFGVPYRPEQHSLDLSVAAQGIRQVFDRYCGKNNLPEPILMAEPGRWIMADTAWLVGRVHVIKSAAKTFVGIDAGMNDLPRPAIYDAYHHISLVQAGRKGPARKVNVVGRLCENNDQFARDRLLPPIRVGDLLAIHNAGAHAYAMGHHYNNRLRGAEILLTQRGSLMRIRRAEVISDLFATTSLR